MLDWSVTSHTQFCSVGPNHLFFWNLDSLQGGIVKPKAGTFGIGAEKVTQLCLAHGDAQNTYTGGLNGHVYLWMNGALKTSA